MRFARLRALIHISSNCFRPVIYVEMRFARLRALIRPLISPGRFAPKSRRNEVRPTKGIDTHVVFPPTRVDWI